MKSKIKIRDLSIAISASLILLSLSFYLLHQTSNHDENIQSDEAINTPTSHQQKKFSNLYSMLKAARPSAKDTQDHRMVDRAVAESTLKRIEEIKSKLRKSVKNVPDSEKIHSDGRQFTWRPELIAIPSDDYQASMGPAVTKRTTFTVITKKDKNDPHFAIGSSSEMPVVENLNNLQIGIVTGTLVIKLKQDQSAEELASKYGMELKSTVPHLNVAFLTAKPGIDIRSQLVELKKDSMIDTAEIEILDSEVTAK